MSFLKRRPLVPHKLFTPFGPLVRVIKITNTTAIVKFKKHSKATQAMNQLNGVKFLEHPITITMANNIPTKRHTRYTNIGVSLPIIENRQQKPLWKI